MNTIKYIICQIMIKGNQTKISREIAVLNKIGFNDITRNPQ